MVIKSYSQVLIAGRSESHKIEKQFCKEKIIIYFIFFLYESIYSLIL